MVLGRLRRYGTQLGIRQAGFRAADALSLAPGACLSEPDAFRDSGRSNSRAAPWSACGSRSRAPSAAFHTADASRSVDDMLEAPSESDAQPPLRRASTG